MSKITGAFYNYVKLYYGYFYNNWFCFNIFWLTLKIVFASFNVVANSYFYIFVCFRSFVILLGVLYRYQKRNRRIPDFCSTVPCDQSQILGASCARYWSWVNKIGHTIRQGVNSAPVDMLPDQCRQNQAELAQVLNIQQEDIIMVWVSEMEKLVKMTIITRKILTY